MVLNRLHKTKRFSIILHFFVQSPAQKKVLWILGHRWVSFLCSSLYISHVDRTEHYLKQNVSIFLFKSSVVVCQYLQQSSPAVNRLIIKNDTYAVSSTTRNLKNNYSWVGEWFYVELGLLDWHGLRKKLIRSKFGLDFIFQNSWLKMLLFRSISHIFVCTSIVTVETFWIL